MDMYVFCFVMNEYECTYSTLRSFEIKMLPTKVSNYHMADFDIVTVHRYVLQLQVQLEVVPTSLPVLPVPDDLPNEAFYFYKFFY